MYPDPSPQWNTSVGTALVVSRDSEVVDMCGAALHGARTWFGSVGQAPGSNERPVVKRKLCSKRRAADRPSQASARSEQPEEPVGASREALVGCRGDDMDLIILGTAFCAGIVLISPLIIYWAGRR
jgi:hypothetical protein